MHDPDFHKTVKVPLLHILTDPKLQVDINNAVIRCHKIVTRTMFFLKFYFLSYYDQFASLPIIDHTLIETCLKIVCLPPSSGCKPSKDTQNLKDHLTPFYTDFSKLIVNEPLSYTNFITVFNYLATEILTMYENNIKQHYSKYINHYLNAIFVKKSQIKKIEQSDLDQTQKKEEIDNIHINLKNIKSDLLNPSNDHLESNEEDHDWIKYKKSKILPNKPFFEKNFVLYDVHKYPFEYLPGMIYMMKEVEKTGLKMLNVFPLRTEIIPKHMPIDTTTVVHLFCVGNKEELANNIRKFKDEIWNIILNTKKRCFKKKNYHFHHMIKTDGVSCSLLFSRIKNENEDEKKKKDKKNKNKNNKISNVSIDTEVPYINKLPDYTHLKDKKIVAIDPGKCDLIHCIDGDTKDSNKFRYTQDQRRKETKKKKFANIHLELKCNSEIYTIKDLNNNQYTKTQFFYKDILMSESVQKIEEPKKPKKKTKSVKDKCTEKKEKTVMELKQNKKVMDLESKLSHFNRKTLDLTQYKMYLIEKCEVNHKLLEFYKQDLFRKLKLNSYLNTLKSEQKMINNFERIFGKKDEVVVCFGDHQQKSHLKHMEPTKGVGMRKLFKRAGYQIYLVNEFRTSCRCANCGGKNEKFMKRNNPRPFQKGSIEVHGLLRCQNGCSLWNRDTNAAINIYKIAKNAVEGKERPEYLKREDDKSSNLEKKSISGTSGKSKTS